MQGTETRTFATEAERRRVQAVVETLARTRQRGSTATEVAHDARNMVTALELYCDLLGEPGVLASGYGNYASELKLVASASRRLVEKLMLLDGQESADAEEARRNMPSFVAGLQGFSPLVRMSAERLPGDPIEDLQKELEANRNLLDAMAGLAISVTVKAEGGARPVRLTSEDLTRVLVNLVKNAAEAMRRAGRIEIGLREREAAANGVPDLVLPVAESGPGIREGRLERIFEAGFTTHAESVSHEGELGWPSAHRGLGLSITSAIVQAAGGRIHAENRDEGGARMVLELPIRQR